MNWNQIKFGAEPKKVAFLVGLVVLIGVSYLYNRTSGDSPAPSHPSALNPAPVAPAQKVPIRPVAHAGMRVTQSGLKQISREAHPDLKPKIVDPSSVDPTLHLSLLSKLQDVRVEGSPRSLFEVSDHAPAATLAIKEPAKIPISAAIGPKPPPPPPGPPPVAEAPRIALKFYGFVNPSRPTNKRAFFLDGEEIVIAGEGELIKKRYKIVRIGVNSAVVEDTTFKGNNTQQTLPLEAELPG